MFYDNGAGVLESGALAGLATAMSLLPEELPVILVVFVLRSFVSDGGTRRLYQEGPVSNMRSPEELIKLYTGGDKLSVGTAMFCGTFAVHGGFSYGGTFEMEMEDPILGRKLTHSYKTVSLPDEG